jgi:hypothetical protein
MEEGEVATTTLQQSSRQQALNLKKHISSYIPITSNAVTLADSRAILPDYIAI